MPANIRRCSYAQPSTSASRFWIAAWLGAVMPTRRPLASAATTIRAPRNVLPVPGGPWTGRTEWSSARVADTSASMSSPSPPDVRVGGSRRSRQRTAWKRSSPASTEEARAMSASRRTATGITSRLQARRVPGPVASAPRRSTTPVLLNGDDVVALVGGWVVGVAGLEPELLDGERKAVVERLLEGDGRCARSDLR